MEPKIEERAYSFMISQLQSLHDAVLKDRVLGEESRKVAEVIEREVDRLKRKHNRAQERLRFQPGEKVQVVKPHYPHYGEIGIVIEHRRRAEFFPILVQWPNGQRGEYAAYQLREVN